MPTLSFIFNNILKTNYEIMKFDWKDISIVPAKVSRIESRNQIDIKINGKLPIFSAPMDRVIDEKNCDFFGQKIMVCLPRGLKNEKYFESFSIKEAYQLFDNGKLPSNVLIDIANGNMEKIFDISNKIKTKYGKDINLMVGNIANPATYEEYCKIGVDYVRCGVGGGSACLTAQNVGIFYPMASLIIECRKIAKKYENPPKIIADGGFKEYSEIIKALALGADFVMIGGILSKTVESCSDSFIKIADEFKKIKKKEAISYFREGGEIFKEYRGMSTKEVQRDWGRENIKTSEGIIKYNLVEYTFESWIENFEDYLRSCMSYTNSINLKEFIGNVEFIEISNQSLRRFEK